MTNLLTRKPRFLFLFAASILHLFSFPSMAAKLQDHPEKQNEESFSWTGITVEQLAAACKETVENKTSSTLDCFSYMDGFLDGYALASGLDKDELEFCLRKTRRFQKTTLLRCSCISQKAQTGAKIQPFYFLLLCSVRHFHAILKTSISIWKGKTRALTERLRITLRINLAARRNNGKGR